MIFLYAVLMFLVPVLLLLLTIWYLMTPHTPNWNQQIGGTTQVGNQKWKNVGKEKEWATYNIPSSHRQLCECPDCMEPGLRGPFYPENTI